MDHCEHCEDIAHKHTPRSPELTADLTRRLNRVIGQLGGVKTMLGKLLEVLEGAENIDLTPLRDYVK